MEFAWKNSNTTLGFQPITGLFQKWAICVHVKGPIRWETLFSFPFY